MSIHSTYPKEAIVRITADLLQSTLDIANQAGNHLKDFYKKSVDIQTKSDNTPVTEADLFVSHFLTEKLTALTPNIPVLSEENCNISLDERCNWSHYWLIDPLDGTQQFINRTDQFSVIICLVENHSPRLGIIHAPLLDKTYYALKGEGAFLLEKNHLRRLSPLTADSTSRNIKIALGSSDPDKIRHCIRKAYNPIFMPYGSSSLKAGLVAEGIADCYVRLGNTGEWDTAAAEVLLGELGGHIFDVQFRPLTYNCRNTLINPHFVMVNARIDWHNIFQFD